MTLSNPSGGGGPAPTLDSAKTTVTTTIADDDDTPTAVALSVDHSTLGESASATDVTVTATLEGSVTLASDLVVTLALGGTAGSGDYSGSLATVTIGAGSLSGSDTLTVTPTQDLVVEGAETIVVSGTAAGFAVSDASVTITDDDTATLSVSGPSAVTEGAAAVFTVTLSHRVAAEVSVTWTAAGSGASAASGSDLGSVSGSVMFAAGSVAGATRTVSIAAVDDLLSEGVETFTLTLGSVSSSLSGRVSVSSVAGSAEASIAESDPITVEVTGPSTVAEGDTTGEYTVALTPAGWSPPRT